MALPPGRRVEVSARSPFRITALRAAAADLEHPHPSDAGHGPAAGDPGVSAGTPAAGLPMAPTTSSLAGGLARRGWVEPDLLPFPWSHQGSAAG